MKATYSKIQKCREEIKSTVVKKKGHNDYSNYDYFTPEQVHELTFNVCKQNELFCKFDLDKDQFGLFGKLTVINLEVDEHIEFIQRTDVPSITATNITQQMGGAVTYTQRYLLMTVFDIQDNNSDPDTTQNTKSREENKKEATEQLKRKSEEIDKPWLNKWSNKEKTEVKETYTKIVLAANDKGFKISDLRKHYKISKEVEKELETDLN